MLGSLQLLSLLAFYDAKHLKRGHEEKWAAGDLHLFAQAGKEDTSVAATCFTKSQGLLVDLWALCIAVLLHSLSLTCDCFAASTM